MNISRHHVDQQLWSDHDNLSFSFNFVNHISEEKYGEAVFNKICEAISKCYKSEIPISARLLENYQLYPISSNHSLHEFLDEESQRNQNFLIFMRRDGHVLVRWFGPFVNTDHLGSIVERVTRSHLILKNIREAMTLEQDEEDSDEKFESGKTDLMEKYWKNVKDILAKIEAKKIELKGFAYQVFDEPTADKLTKQLHASSGKVLVKGVAAILLAEIAEELGSKIAGMVATKTAAKAATKGGSTGFHKIAAKSVPVLSLAVGIGFGVWRCWRGDLTGAGLEVMSGAAACIPGSGTATSLAIDAGLIARDVYEAKKLDAEGIEQLKEDMSNLDQGLKDLYDNYDSAMAEYEFVKDVLDLGFCVRNIDHEIKILDNAVNILDSLYDEYVLM
ncbi:uncharacterized protein LOC114536039 [Dendronephthya gigantea]|uniref:uncharacterized protein LOC114536039 n=1 Tax=Dendronephthya gigantea TaxID=151771 RepID=UPI00106C5D8C|nr:uncharacterized protein LOC114536039 [Dendronephthya gigantea]XP_028413197.1 uncharacterized protein LOC114536039 [Dendronephthya gigantea]